MPGARAFTVDHEITDPAAFLVPNVELHMVAGTRLSPDSCWSTTTRRARTHVSAPRWQPITAMRPDDPQTRTTSTTKVGGFGGVTRYVARRLPIDATG